MDLHLNQKLEGEILTLQANTNNVSGLLKKQTDRFTKSLDKVKVKQKDFKGKMASIKSEYKGKVAKNIEEKDAFVWELKEKSNKNVAAVLVEGERKAE